MTPYAVFRNFNTKHVRTVIVHILDRTDCPKHNLNIFVGIFPKIPKFIFRDFLYKSLTPIVERRGLCINACAQAATQAGEVSRDGSPYDPLLLDKQGKDIAELRMAKPRIAANRRK